MKKTRYTEEQIAFALRQEDAGTPVADIIRKLGVSEVDFPTDGERSDKSVSSP